MSAPIIKHDTPKHPDDDPGRPIPSVATLDVAAVIKSVGADLDIVIASPLASDERALTRLLDKIQGYLGTFKPQSLKMRLALQILAIPKSRS